MRYKFALWRDKLLLLTLLAFFYAYSSPVRVAIRAALEGRDFSWGYTSGITPEGKIAMAWGKGLQGHTDYILHAAFPVIWLLCAVMRRPDRFVQAALVGWTSIGLGVGLWLGFSLGDSLTSSKQTLGLTGLSYMWMEVLPAAVAWLLALALFVRGPSQAQQEARSVWLRINTMLITCAAGFMLLSAFLLNAGPQHGNADFHGVGMMYFALIFLMLGVAPWEKRSAPVADAASPGKASTIISGESTTFA